VRRSISAEDRRRSVLRLSTEGEAVYREIAPVALRYERALVDCLHDGEMAALDAVLEKLTAKAQSLASVVRARKS
jgi:DNA-binding MarR family transcriptional regulator